MKAVGFALKAPSAQTLLWLQAQGEHQLLQGDLLRQHQVCGRVRLGEEGWGVRGAVRKEMTGSLHMFEQGGRPQARQELCCASIN